MQQKLRKQEISLDSIVQYFYKHIYVPYAPNYIRIKSCSISVCHQSQNESFIILTVSCTNTTVVSSNLISMGLQQPLKFQKHTSQALPIHFLCGRLTHHIGKKLCKISCNIFDIRKGFIPNDNITFMLLETIVVFVHETIRIVKFIPLSFIINFL